MNIDPHKMSNPLQGPLKRGVTKKTKSSETASASALNTGSEVFGGSEIQEVIRESLESMPEIRQHLVEVGRELAGDDNYPSAEDLDALSRLALESFGKDAEEEA
jgi:hypothetical protein